MAISRIALTHTTIKNLVELVQLGVSQTAAAHRCGINPATYRSWMLEGRKHLATGQPTMQTKLVRAIEAAQENAKRIDWMKMHDEAPAAWLTLQPLVDEVECEAVSDSLGAKARAHRLEVEQRLRDALKAREASDDGTPDRD